MNEKPLIMIVDDLVKNLKLLGNTLIDEGYEIVMAINGQQALDMLIEITPDLILLDIMMPEMDGYEVCEKLKKNTKTSDIPIIFLTAKSDPEDIVKAFNTGGIDYIIKPTQKDEALARIKTHLELKFYREEIEKKSIELETANNKLVNSKLLLENYLSVIKSDLSKAAEYVTSLFPMPMNDGIIRTSWHFVPSADLGGDSFGYHWIDKNNFAFYMIDVCGHGVGPALYSVSALNTLRFQTLPKTDFKQSDQVLNNLNNVFQMLDHNDMFFTMWYCVFNTNTRELDYCGGGHPPLISINKKNELEFIESKNTMVGVIPNYQFESESRVLDNDTTLYIYSDGVYEVDKVHGKKMTYEDLADFLIKNKDESDNEIEGLYDHIREISKNKTLDDDFSILKLIVL